MKIINYDAKAGAKQTEYKDNKSLPTWPFRMLVVGGSGCGKTNLVLNLLLNDDGLDYDKLLVISTSLYQPTYKHMIETFTEKDSKRLKQVEADIKKYNRKNKTKYTLQTLTDIDPSLVEPTLETFNTVGEFKESFDLENCNVEQRLLILFDDVMCEKGQNDISWVFSRGRHLNISSIYISQSFFAVPKTIRLNCSAYVLFNLNDREINEIQARVVTDINKNDFRQLYKTATSRHYGFLVIDYSKRLSDKYKIGFE